MGSIMITHSLADLDALATEEDRAKARGFMDRSAITVLAGLPPRELARVSQVTPLTGPEQELVASWSAPDSWPPRARHPRRGRRGGAGAGGGAAAPRAPLGGGNAASGWMILGVCWGLAAAAAAVWAAA